MKCQFCGDKATKKRFKPSKDYPIAYDLCKSCADKHTKAWSRL